SSSLKATGSINAGDGPDAMLYEPATHRVFAFNGHSQDATVIDPTTDQVVQTIPLKGKPELPVADGKGKIFVNLENTAEIAEIDGTDLKVVERWPLKGCEEPTGLAMDAKASVLFSACGNKVMAITSAKDGQQIAKVPIGDRVD